MIVLSMLCLADEDTSMTSKHFTWESLAGYLGQTGSHNERSRVQWHLEHCSVCKDQIKTVRDLLNAANSTMNIWHRPNWRTIPGGTERTAGRMNSEIKVSRIPEAAVNRQP